MTVKDGIRGNTSNLKSRKQIGSNYVFYKSYKFSFHLSSNKFALCNMTELIIFYLGRVLHPATLSAARSTTAGVS
jgi:hypothetical protein